MIVRFFERNIASQIQKEGIRPSTGGQDRERTSQRQRVMTQAGLRDERLQLLGLAARS